MSGEKNQEGVDPHLMQMSSGPSARVGLLNLLCPGGKICSCLVSHVEKPGPCGKKILNYHPMVDTEKGQERYVADQDRAGGEGFASIIPRKSWIKEDSGCLKHHPVVQDRQNSTVLTQERKPDPNPKPRSLA